MLRAIIVKMGAMQFQLFCRTGPRLRDGRELVNLGQTIAPSELAFDIDGVVADTMAVFVRLAREHYGFTWMTKDDLRQYDLHACLSIDRGVLDELICMTLDDEHTQQVPPMQGAAEVLTELAEHGPLRFVTARIWPESIVRWLHQTLPDVDSSRIEVFATGLPEAKCDILRELKIRYFVEDRLETCELLSQNGIQPLLFDQPWNRLPEAVAFPRIENWSQLGQRVSHYERRQSMAAGGQKTECDKQAFSF